MEIFLDNFYWMIPNIALASVGFILAQLYLHTKTSFLGIPLFILWLLFMPNTVYLLTDIQYLPGQLVRTDVVGVVLLIVQYIFLIFLGVLTYFAAMMPLESFFRKKKSKKTNYSYIFIIANFAASFAVVLGKIERTHSWYVFTQPVRVVEDILSVLNTPLLLSAVIVLGVFFNIMYFGIRNKIPNLK